MNLIGLCFSISKESIIDVEGFVRKTDMKIESCTQQDVELHVEQVGTVAITSTLTPDGDLINGLDLCHKKKRRGIVRGRPIIVVELILELYVYCVKRCELAQTRQLGYIIAAIYYRNCVFLGLMMGASIYRG